jgi:histidinol-phosphate/aromatic aminotransferase/cobyric acid decarboxylase-like protein/CTP:molybdopterin cytidylyltransferase MocA
MHGLILAAGRGTRLGRVGEQRPKPLLELPNGETLLGRLVRQMDEAGIRDITIVVGHMAEVVVDFVESLPVKARIRYINAPDYATTNNVVSMLLGLQSCTQSYQTHESLLFAECDVVIDDAEFRRIAGDGDDNIAVVSPYEIGMDGTVVTVDGGFVTDVIPPRRQGTTFCLDDHFKTVNVYRFDERVWRYRLPRLLDWQISEVGASDYYENSIGMIVYAIQSELRAHIIPSDSWHEIDDLNDLRIANEKLFLGHDVNAVLATHGGWWDLPYLDFAYLRNMHFPPEAMVAQIKDALPGLLQNYGSSQSRVDEKLSWLLGVDAENLIALPGLSVIYPQMKSEYNSPFTWIPEESFGEYRSRLPKASVYVDADWARVIVENDVETLVIVNPNNPTGHLTPIQDIVAAAESRPDVRFVVDESFIFFTDEPSLTTHRRLPRNILLLRSMSKEIGMPGVRLGFAYSTDAELTHRIRSNQPVWALNSIAEFITTLMLKYQKEFSESFNHFKSDHQSMQARLREEPGILVQDGVYGCFLLAETSDDLYPEVGPALARHGILVKDVTGRVAGSEGSTILRLAVRPDSDIDRLVAALRAARVAPS